MLKHTGAYEAFVKGLQQSFMLTDALRRAGELQGAALVARAAAEIKRVTGLEMEEYLALSKEEQARIPGVTWMDVAQAKQLEAESKAFKEHATQTIPHVLFIFLLTKFEAFLEDILIATFSAVSSLLSVAEAEKLSAKKGWKPKTDPTTSIRDRVHTIVYGMKMDELGSIVFTRALGIDFEQICQRVGITAKELDIAKSIRNIHLHNQGLIDQQFIMRSGYSHLKEGDFYPIEIKYLIDTKNGIQSLTSELDLELIRKYPNIN